MICVILLACFFCTPFDFNQKIPNYSDLEINKATLKADSTSLHYITSASPLTTQRICLVIESRDVTIRSPIHVTCLFAPLLLDQVAD